MKKPTRKEIHMVAKEAIETAEDEVRVNAVVMEQCVCDHAREDCGGCYHCTPHEERVDVAETEGCSNELECVFHGIKVKCTPVA